MKHQISLSFEAAGFGTGCDKKYCLLSLIWKYMTRLLTSASCCELYNCKILIDIACGVSFIRLMLASTNGNIFRVTVLLCGEFTAGHRWIPHTKANDAEIWCFLWSALEPTVEQTIVTLVIWGAIALIMTSLQYTFQNTWGYQSIKMLLHQYQNSHYNDKTVVSWPPFQYNNYALRKRSLYIDGRQNVTNFHILTHISVSFVLLTSH